ncbi:hypothetical protein BGX38DRAFT_600075 [Terfezia claveryi]|nr:hypothetical protein BGX38DRAFT_600075 [Terfezia claveryi]
MVGGFGEFFMMDEKVTVGLLVLLAVATLVWLVNRCMVVGKEERVIRMNVELEKQKVGVEKQKVEGDIAIEKQKVKGEIEVAKDKIEADKGENRSGKRENCCQEAKGWWGEGWKREEKKVNRTRFVFIASCLLLFLACFLS